MEIQGGSQPIEEAVSTPGLDLWISCRPHHGAASGGDVHYVSLCGGGIITRLIIADVSGHGERVAGLSGSLRTLVRKNINTKSQTSLVRALNREFAVLAEQRRFATAVVATYLANRRRLTVCNAGHPRPLSYRAAEGRWEALDRGLAPAGDLPLGIDDDSPYHQFTLDLGPGDVVLFYTDALTEAASPSGQMLGEEGLLSLVRGLAPAEPRRFGPALLAAVEQYRGGRAPDDDTTLLVLHHNAAGPRWRSLRERVDVYAKVFGMKAF
jgi:serine phosphatase RsbU (regulator of sigma subunit)